MREQEYLEQAFEAYNAGRIDAETYDAILMQIDEFVEEEKSYSPSNPWDAPGMCINDFVPGVQDF